MTTHTPRGGHPAAQLEADTRMRVLTLLLRHRSLSASHIAKSVDVSSVAVRKHLAHLAADGLVEVAPGKAHGKRGRPATSWAITDAGRALFGHSYDELAVQALAALRTIGGDEAVMTFARQRAHAILDGIEPAASESAADVSAAANRVAHAFSDRGYAATVQHAGIGVQICQHHCPVAVVAGEFPQLCDAEAEVISELVGHPVQPLATISGGHGICTTNVSLASALVPPPGEKT